MQSQRQRAFTLVELLVVIAIIGVLVQLLLPAVQAAREAGRRMSCQNNLKQLQLALHTYESSLQVFPPAGILDKPTDLRSGKMFSWIVMILPQIEQQSLYDTYDFKVDALNQSKEPQATPLATLMCPSDQARGKFYADSSFTNSKRFAKGNYAAYCSPMHTDTMVDFPGALVAHRGQTPADIRD
ncbi:MAG TPA: DUF1559 domain-containing protein, partial [Pirellulaceae bacterium]|nr:DUF1559 domain-containing protein [Pirellulaceae bacterium]